MTQAVYRFEGAFHLLTGRVTDVVADDRRPHHRAGRPGGARALGVGYGTIHAELLGQLGLSALALLFVVKLLIWSAGLGSGTSGGILFSVLMLGAAIGGILGHALPGTTPGVWGLIGLAGAMGGVTRRPSPPSFSPSSSHTIRTACWPSWWRPRSRIWSACSSSSVRS